ncbi:MAG: hypothetical protein WKF65_08690 [Gaiellaceae bacterium]
MPPDFLNSREDAILLWTIVILGFVFYKDFRGIGGSFLAVFRSLMSPKLLLLFGSALLYSAVVVYGASELGLWHTSALTATIYWFLGTGVVLAGEAVTDGARDGRVFLRRVLRRVVAVTIVVEFVVNVYALPFAFEVVGVFLLLSFVGVRVVAQRDSSTPAPVLRFIDVVLATIGVVYLGYFVIRVFGDVPGFLTRENAEDFLVGPALTLALIPFLFAAAWWSRREDERLHKRLRARFDSPG